MQTVIGCVYARVCMCGQMEREQSDAEERRDDGKRHSLALVDA